MDDDWRTRNKMSSREAMKAAAAVLGLMVSCVFVLWVLARLMR